jgi:quercetin dioxygenase-like cupin family protein
MTTPAEIAANPIGTDLIYEDDHVRIWRIDLEPGGEAAIHTHELDYTTIVVEGDVVERPNDDGTVDRMVVAPGGVMRWHQGTRRHSLRNVGSTVFHNVIVELKAVPADFSRAT